MSIRRMLSHYAKPTDWAIPEVSLLSLKHQFRFEVIDWYRCDVNNDSLAQCHFMPSNKHARSWFLVSHFRCQCGLEAKRAEEGAFAVQVCSKAIASADLEDLRVGPWPTEVESALLLTQAAYTKAQCLSWDIEDQGLLSFGMKMEVVLLKHGNILPNISLCKMFSKSVDQGTWRVYPLVQQRSSLVHT